MAKDWFDEHIEVVGSDKKLADAIKKRMKEMLPERISTGHKKCWNCGKIITKENYKKHYPVISGMFCKE